MQRISMVRLPSIHGMSRVVTSVAQRHSLTRMCGQVMERLPEVVDDLQPMELTNVIWACGKLGSAPPGSVERLVPMLIERRDPCSIPLIMIPPPFRPSQSPM